MALLEEAPLWGGEVLYAQTMTHVALSLLLLPENQNVECSAL